MADNEISRLDPPSIKHDDDDDQRQHASLSADGVQEVSQDEKQDINNRPKESSVEDMSRNNNQNQQIRQSFSRSFWKVDEDNPDDDLKQNMASDKSTYPFQARKDDTSSKDITSTNDRNPTFRSASPILSDSPDSSPVPDDRLASPRGMTSQGSHHQEQAFSLSQEEHAAIIAENEQAIGQAETAIDPDSSDATSIMSSGFSDAGYASDSVASASTSISSSVRDYIYENGRRYHRFREGQYNFPNDDSEQDREDMKHSMMMQLCQRLHFAPIDPNLQNVLDMGTGTGIWAVEMGDEYPSASVLGVDLSGIQPTWVPPNVRFMIDDVESPWLHPPNHFDYIHARHTIQAFRDWPKILERAYTHMKPGGWIELQEIYHFPQCHDGTMPKDHPVVRYWDLIKEGLAELGLDFAGTLGLCQKMKDAGFVNVTERIFHVPIGVWPRNKILKTVGLYWRTVLMDGLHPIALGPLMRGLKWSREEVEVFLMEVRKAYMDTWVHSHMPLHIIYGQRPEADTAVRDSN